MDFWSTGELVNPQILLTHTAQCRTSEAFSEPRNKKIGESKNTRRNLNILCGECGIIRNKERIEEQAKQIPIYTPDLRKCSLEEINKLLVDAKAVLDELKKKEEVSIK